ncbi:MAG TPA: protein kinase [Vicinamibacterales bacterium]|nr:protein kinase [Vicinamibacterales bacterium]
MSIQEGNRLLHYRIAGKIGEGGMGEVWQARDTTLDRDVAIKILPEAFATDSDRLGRFEREAKLLASINHPNIAGIYGLHADQGVRFLAMELVPGEDLADRIARGPVAVDEAIAIASRIAEALEYAHEHGIVHRDLKPANIKVAPDGDVKVLDFGLAKAMAVDADGSLSGQAPSMATMTSPAMTQAGIILGTAAYMSPEQARGRPVDKRADNWAFGCVLYEMLTGRRLFGGDTVTDVIAAVVTREPDWSRLPASTPASVRRLLGRCLDKDPRTRLRDIGEARIALAGAGSDEPAAVTTAAVAPAPSRATWWMAAAAVALAAGLFIGRFALAPAPPPASTYEFDITVPDRPIETGSFALSPDGSRLALVIRDETGNRQLAVRDMNAAEVRMLPGTVGALYPFWSPSGREIAFFSGDQLSRISIDGAAPRPIATVAGPRGGAWAQGDIIIVGSELGPIQKVPASGATQLENVTELDAGVEDGHMWPSLLPDGQRFVFLADSATTEGHRIWLGDLAGGAATMLRSGVRSQPVVDATGRLLLGERGQLVAYGFDVGSGSLSDESTLVAADVYPIGTNHTLPASTAAGGMVAFQHTSPESNLVLLDQAGRVTRTIGRPDRYGNMRMSPDMKRVAFEIYTDTPERLVWVEDLERGVRTPMSVRGQMADSTAWSPDGQIVYFDSDASGKWEAYGKTLTGGGDAEGLGVPEGATEPLVLDVSRDGRWLLGAAITGQNRNDLYLRDLQAGAGAGGWTSWLATPAQEMEGAFSPDSRWVAYATDASGRSEVFVAPFEGGPSRQRWQISSSGGFEPEFSPDGKTLYYRSATFEWMAVDITLGETTVEAGTPQSLFRIPSLELPFLRNLMDVLPDGSGFLNIQPVTSDTLSIRVRTGR